MVSADGAGKEISTTRIPAGSVGLLGISLGAWAVLDRLEWYLNEFGRDLIALVIVLSPADHSSVIPPTPYGLYGAYLLPVVTTVGATAVLVGWFSCVLQFYDTNRGLRPDWRRGLVVATGRVWSLVGYAVLTVTTVGLGLLAAVVPGVYLAGKLVPGSTAVLHGEPVVETARRRVDRSDGSAVRVSCLLILFSVLGAAGATLLGTPTGLVVAGIGWAKVAADFGE
ncbi:MAG: hypothetical protein ABEI75_01895 [Halobaculum sp.]